MFDNQLNPQAPISFVHQHHLVTVFQDGDYGFRHLIQTPDENCPAEISGDFDTQEKAIADAKAWIDQNMAELTAAIAA